MTKASPAPVALLCLLLACTAAPARQQSQSAAPPPEPTVACQLCPQIIVRCPEAVKPGEPVTFTPTVEGVVPSPSLTFRWVASAGVFTTATEGALADVGHSIVLDTTGVTGGTDITVTFEVGGLDRSCSNSGSCTVHIISIPHWHPIDTYGDIRFEDEQARLDNFAIELQLDPEVNGYIDCYGGRRGRRGEARARCERAKKYLTGRRGISPDRLVTVDGGFREQLTVVLWIMPPGKGHAPSPTVDPSEVKFTGVTRKRRGTGAKRD